MKKFITFLVLLLFVRISISAEPTTPTKQRKDINLEQISIRGGKDNNGDLTQQFSTFTLFTLYIGEPTEPLNIKVTTEANIYTGMLIAL